MIKNDPEKLFKSGWALKLPKMNCKELLYEECLTELAELKNSKHSFSFLTTEKNEHKCIYTGFGEEEFLMLSILTNRHIPLFNLLKLVVLDVEKNRQLPCEEHDFTYKALEYIKLKKLTNLNLELK
jgi:hypothetical protein